MKLSSRQQKEHRQLFSKQRGPTEHKMHCQVNSHDQKQLSMLLNMLRLGTLGRDDRWLEQHSQLHSSRMHNARSRLLSKVREGRPCRLSRLGSPGREGTGLKQTRQLHSR